MAEWGRQVALRESGGTGRGGMRCPAAYMGLGQLRRGDGGGKGGQEPGKCCASRSAPPGYLKMMLGLEKPYFFRKMCALWGEKCNSPSEEKYQAYGVWLPYIAHGNTALGSVPSVHSVKLTLWNEAVQLVTGRVSLDACPGCWEQREARFGGWCWVGGQDWLCMQWTALCPALRFGAVLGTAFICHSAEGCALVKAMSLSGLLNANLRAAIHRCSEVFKMRLNCTVPEGRLWD